MEGSTKYQISGKWFETFHIRTNEEVRILVRELETGRPTQCIRFYKPTGRIMHPKEWPISETKVIRHNTRNNYLSYLKTNHNV